MIESLPIAKLKAEEKTTRREFFKDVFSVLASGSFGVLTASLTIGGVQRNLINRYNILDKRIENIEKVLRLKYERKT